MLIRDHFFHMFFSFPRWFAPNVDGQLLPDTPKKLLFQGKFAKVNWFVQLQMELQRICPGLKGFLVYQEVIVHQHQERTNEEMRRTSEKKKIQKQFFNVDKGPFQYSRWPSLKNYTPKMRGHKQQWISHKMNNRHPWKKSKSWRPFWSYQLNSTANPVH